MVVIISMWFFWVADKWGGPVRGCLDLLSNSTFPINRISRTSIETRRTTHPIMFSDTSATIAEVKALADSKRPLFSRARRFITARR